MARFGSGDDAFGLREQAARLEAVQLRDIDRFHHLVFQQLRYDHARSVVAQSAGMNVGRGEIMSEREHRQQRRVACLVAKIVAEHAARQFRTRVRFGGDETRLFARQDAA